MKSSLGRRGTILVVAALAAAAIAGGALAAIAAHGTSRAVTSVIHVTEGASGYTIGLDKSTVPPGKVTFIVTNSGTIAHKFALIGKVAMGHKKAIKALIQPGQTKSITIPLTKRTYLVVCPLHRAQGMSATLTVASTPATTTNTNTTVITHPGY
jgi:plastocyanin